MIGLALIIFALVVVVCLQALSIKRLSDNLAVKTKHLATHDGALASLRRQLAQQRHDIRHLMGYPALDPMDEPEVLGRLEDR